MPWAGSVGLVIAREGGLISVKLASRLSIVASVLGELIDPRVLNAGEERLLEHSRTMKEIEELNIGHSIISRAVFIGLENAVKEMLGLIKRC